MNTTNITVFEADDRGQDEVLFGFLIAGPIYVAGVIFMLILVGYQKLDIRQIRRSEEALALRLRALEEGMWIEDINNNLIETPPMYPVNVESLTPHSTDRNYVQLQFSTFRVPTKGE